MRTSSLLLPVGASVAYALPAAEDKRQSQTIAISETTPSDASDTVDHGYPAFAFSQHSWHEYAGNKSSPNSFSANLIAEVASRTGRSPLHKVNCEICLLTRSKGTSVHIRVGGTSGDFSYYNASQTDSALVLPPNTPCGSIPHGMQIGPSWFQGFANINAKYTYQSHFANNTGGFQDNSAAASVQAMKYIPSSNLDSLEIGNEINYYPGSNRPSGYSVSTYLSEWKSYAKSITTAISNTAVPFQAPVLFPGDATFNYQNIFNAGQDSQGYTVATTSLHHYMDLAPVPIFALQTNYMNHTNIAAKLDIFKPVVSWLKSNEPSIPLHLGEVNSNTYCTGNANILGVFGSALWLADYMLYGMTLNIKRMNVQQSSGFTYASWRPVTYCGVAPAVNPPYYAHPFVADIIGTKGDIQISDLKLGQDTFAGYAIYNVTTNTIRSVVLLNLQTYRTTDSGSRPSKSVTLSVGSSYTGSATVDKLTADGADIEDASQVSWKGISWTYASNGRPVQGASTSVSVRGSRGRIGPITVKASEAVVVTL
ncbi:Hypothetical predicted protein [Lecanosticta acicola]|uniref:Beta-glucuronidase C-terminal domain-containing protein n=1 Tax=Lecanosticta acicola TaxID=111012 RepID=A0AAI9EBX1_9PEZI|nr:Hypothetical predicted protein [Lecanosticta acicola]